MLIIFLILKSIQLQVFLLDANNNENTLHYDIEVKFHLKYLLTLTCVELTIAIIFLLN